MKSLYIFAAVGFSLIATFGIPVAAVNAQPPEQAEEIARGIYRLVQGKYDLGIQVIPSVPTAGTVYFVVTPMLSEDGSPIPEAKVLVIVDDDQGEPTYQSLALNTPENPNQYNANILIKRAGQWLVRVNLRVGEDEVETGFKLTVIERGITGGIAGTITFFVVVTVLFAGGGYIVMRTRRRRSET